MTYLVSIRSLQVKDQHPRQVAGQDQHVLEMFQGPFQYESGHFRKDVPQVYRSVPEAPALDIFADLFQDPPSTNITESKDSVYERNSNRQTAPTVTARGDNVQEEEDAIYLGSQFPLVHKVRASQVPRIQRDGVLEMLAVCPSMSNGQNVENALILASKPQTQPITEAYSPTMNKTFKKRMNGPLKQSHNKQEETIRAPATIILPAKNRGGFKLRSVQEIPELYRKVFSFPYFNIVQSKVFDDVMYTDRSLVLCAPTGSGKTAVFEMAILRLLQQAQTGTGHVAKVVYMAPIKALCSEKFTDWKAKFEQFGLKVMELTGDTETEDFFELQQVNIILTTPEKWDSMTRRWRDNKAVMEAICLFLIDEIHVLNDSTRGATVEAVLSRMKTIQAARSRSKSVTRDTISSGLRFLAVSATITNIEDLAEWLGNKVDPALYYKFDESVRPVRLRKVVLGYYFAEHKQSDFQFDITLSYKLTGIIHTYSENKPTLVFCATRKSAIQGAEILARDGKQSYIRNSNHRQTLQAFSFHIKDTKLRDLVAQGIGYHHAGMDLQDRKNMEQIFANGELPVLVTTSTLAMGVNLPAHLVIIKSTMYYHMGVHQEYSDTQILQMIGRAGRPQFDTSATAVIMTKNQTKMKYENLVNGTQLLESSLHKNLIEHLNAEITLHTITDMSVALEWLKYTFLYIRVMKNPQHYGMKLGMTKSMIEKRLQELCMQSLNQLHGLSLIDMDQETMDVKPTENGRLMARYCISYKTAELFHSIGGSESVPELELLDGSVLQLTVMSKCAEFEDIKLRTNEKKALNTLNKDKNRITIRHPMTGKIKTTDQKVNCLIQAQFGCLLVQDFALQQDTSRIFRAGMRITRCLVEFLSQKKHYKSLLSALQLCKCFKVKLWEDSKYISRQLDGIGPALSTAMVNAGLTTFEKIEQTNPREIELIANRHPPFGNQVRSSIAKLPKYEIVIEQVSKYSMQKAEIVITIQLANREDLQQNEASTTNTAGAMGTYSNHTCTLLVGDEDNHTVCKQRIMDKQLLRESTWFRRLEIKRAEKGPELHIHFVSQDIVGLDVDCSYTPNYLGGKRISSVSATPKVELPRLMPSESQTRQPCNHTCRNKNLCAHECCKTGVTSKRKPAKAVQTPAQTNATRRVTSHLDKIRNMSVPKTPSVAKRIRMDPTGTPFVDLTRFAYTTNKSQNRMLEHDDEHCAIMENSIYPQAGHQGRAFAAQTKLGARKKPFTPGYQESDQGQMKFDARNQLLKAGYQESGQGHKESEAQRNKSLMPGSCESNHGQPIFHDTNKSFMSGSRELDRGQIKIIARNKQFKHGAGGSYQEHKEQNTGLTEHSKYWAGDDDEWEDMEMEYVSDLEQNGQMIGRCEMVGQIGGVNRDSKHQHRAVNMALDGQMLGGFEGIGGVNSASKQQNGVVNMAHKPGTVVQPGRLQNKMDWAELDMYQKCREAKNTAEPDQADDVDSLPDIEQVPDSLYNGHESSYQNLGAEDIVQETDYGYTFVHGEDRDTVPVDWDDKMASQINNESTNTRCTPAQKNWGLDPFQQKSSKRVRGNFTKPPSKKQVVRNSKTPPPQPYTHSDQDNQLNDILYKIEDFSDSDEGLNNENNDDVPSINYQNTDNRVFNELRGPSIYNHIPSKQYGFKKGLQAQEIESDVRFSHPHTKGALNQQENKSEKNKFSFQQVETLNEIDIDLDMYDKPRNVNKNKGDFNRNSSDYSFPLCRSEFDNLQGNIQYEFYNDGNDFRNLLSNDIYRNNVEDSKWENYCNSQESTASDCLNWQYPTRSGTEVVMDRRVQGQRSQHQPLQSKGEGHQGERSMDSLTERGDGISEANMMNLPMLSDCQDLNRHTRKYGQVLAWVSDSDNHRGTSQGSQEWDSCGSDEAKLADLTDVQDPSNSNQQCHDPTKKDKAKPHPPGQGCLRPITYQQQTNPVSISNTRPFTAEILKRNLSSVVQNPSDSSPSNTYTKCLSGVKDITGGVSNKPQGNPSSKMIVTEQESVVLKKPKFSSCFTKEQSSRRT